MLLDHNATDFNGMVAIDGDGKIVWYYQNDQQVFTLAQESNHNLVFNEISQNTGYMMREIGPNGNTIHSVSDTFADGTVCQPHGRWNHEVILRPGHKVWTIGADIRTINVNGPDSLQTGGTIEEWDVDKGTVTRLVSLFDILDPVNDRTVISDTTGGFFWVGAQNQYVGQAKDWTHANSLDVTPDGTIIMSLRHLSQIIAIKPDFSGVAWRLGGPGSDFTLQDPTDQFWLQHCAKVLPNGNLLLFDNGDDRPEEQGGQYSRAMELKLDLSTKTATKVWEYRNNPDLYSDCCSSAYRLPNGNTAVDFGQDSANSPGIFHLVEVDPSNKVIASFQLSADGKNIQYRAIPTTTINGESKGSVSPS